MRIRKKEGAESLRKSAAAEAMFIFSHSPTYISKRKNVRSGSDGRSERGQDEDA
jgi:hypothetical protein